MSEEEHNAMEWLDSIEVYSVTEASYKELILSTLEALSKELKQAKAKIEADEMVHNYDVKMIDEVKGEAVRLYKDIEKKNKIIDMMADWLVGEIHDKDIFETAEDVKEYFERKVENES